MSLLGSLKSAFGSGGGGGGKIDVQARFERQRTAATGTMATFFVAKDRKRDNQLVGVKLLDPEKVEMFEGRFKGLNKPIEGEIAMMMHHPLIAETYEIGTTEKGQPILVMEYVSGPSMQNIVVKKQEHHVEGKRLMLIRQMAQSLQYVHDKGFIHRDICPRNFICMPDTQGVKMIDFGLTVPATPPFMLPGNRTGTPLYMSPEIVRRRATDKRVDIFSLGVTCFCLIAFEHPWQGELVNGRAALNHDTQPPKDLINLCPTVDPRLAKAVMNCLNPKVDERTKTVAQFLSTISTVESCFVS